MKERKLTELMGDMPETEVKRSKVKATVTEQLGDNDFKIKGDNLEVDLEIKGSKCENLEVGFTYEFYSPEKTSSDKFKLTKTSYAKKLFRDETFDKKINNSLIRISDLIGKKNKSLVKECLVAKILALYETRTVGSGKRLR